jgi:hypothetical protein
MKQQYKDMNKLYKNPLYAYQQMMSNIPQMEYGGNNPIPKMQWAGGFNPGSSIFNTQSPIMQTNYAGMANTKKTPAMTNKHWDAKNKRQSYTDEYGRKIVKGFDDKGNVLWTRVDGTVTQRSDAWQNRNKKGSTQGTTQDAAAQAQASKNTGTSTTATTNTGTGTNTGSTVTQGNVNPNAPTTSNTTTSNTNDGNTNQNNTNQGNTPQFGTVFPNVGFGRKGSLPFMYDPANTHLSEITTRRALMPGNRIKKISFTHGMPVQNSMMFNQQGSQSSMVDNQDFNNRSFRNKAADAFLQIPGLRGLGAKMLDHGNAPMPSNEYTSNTSNRFQLPLKPTVPFTTSTPQNLIPLTGIPQNVIAQNTQQVNTPQNVVPQNVPQQTVVSQNTVPQTTVPQTTQQQVVPQKQTSSKSNTSVKPKTTKTSNNTQRQTSNTGTKQNSSAFYQTKIDEMYKKGPYNEEVQKYIDLKNKAEAAEIAQAKKDKWNAAKKAKLAEEQRKDKAAQYNQSSHYNVKERFGGDINYFQEGGPTDTMMYPSEDFQYNNNPFYNYAEFMYPQETYEQDINNEEMYDEEMYDENMITPFHNIGVDYASLVMPYEEYPSEEVMQYGGIFSNNRAGRKNKFKNISINMYGYPPNEEMTDDFNSYTPGYGGGAYPSEDGNYGNFVRNISPSSNTEGFARFSDGTFTSEGYTPPPSYQEGGEYELTDEEIEAIIQNGGEVEFI